MKENLKHIMKRAVRRTRLLLLGLLFARTNKSGLAKRMLLINLGAIGDLVVFTSVLKHYKRAFPDKEISLLISGANGFDPALFRGYIDHIILINPKKFNADFRYGYRFVKKLRSIGFSTVVEHNPHLEWAGKLIAAELGAERVIGYEGVHIDIERPITPSYARGYSYIKKKIFPLYTDVIANTIEQWRISDGMKYLPHIINHHIRIFEYVSERAHAPQQEYATELVMEGHRLPGEAQNLLAKNGIRENGYCLLSLTAGLSAEKEWEMEKYAEVCDYLAAKNIPVVLIGTKGDAERKKSFPRLVQRPVTNLTGMTGLLDIAALMKNCLFTLSNETSVGHMAIALKKPCMVVSGAWNPGLWTFYGYEGINRWVFQKNAPCMGDNGQCIADRNIPAPCVAAIKPDEVKTAIDGLLEYLQSTPAHPQKPFALDFGK